MATYTTLRRGSKGDDVIKLQTALGFTGKDLDGIYGPKTESAVTNYQKSKGLKVDGIAGNETLGSIYGTTPATSTTTPTTPNNVTETKDGDVIQQANSAIQQHIDANKKSPWSDTLTDTINRILNGEKFSYDLNGDTLYQQYKDQYTTQGQMAMMDTMGQAAAMTGGYGNSYAQGVGQQVYQGYMQQLNDRVPELYQLALNQYNQEQQGLQDQASILAALDQQHTDNYYTELGYLTGERDTAYNNAQSEKASERELVLSLLGSGVMPDSARLDMAGISIDEAKNIINAVEESKKTGAVVDTRNFSLEDSAELTSTLQGFKDNKDNEGLEKHLKGLLALGTISPSQYNELISQYEFVPTLDDKEYYEGFESNDWYELFNEWRTTKGQVYAVNKLDEYTKKGLIPENMLTYAAQGARGVWGH